MGGISIWQLLIIAVIVVRLFGTKKLRGSGGALGAAVKGFKKALSDDTVDAKPEQKDAEFPPKPPGQVSAKGTTETEVVNGFQHAGLAAAVAPDQDVETGRQLETGLLDIAKVAELELDQGHD